MSRLAQWMLRGSQIDHDRGFRAAVRSSAAVVLAAMLGGASTSAAATLEDFEACNEKAGNCFEENQEPGCNDPECCKLVCSIDSFCCTNSWDLACVQFAESECEPPSPCPGEGSCFEPHEGVGCDDETCCALICIIDSFCCSVAWDEQCAALAGAFCDARPCTLPPLTDELFEEEPCDERTNDGCTLPEAAVAPISCGNVIRGTAFAGTPRDTDWYELTIDQQREVTWRITSEFPAQLLLIEGTCEHALTVVAEAYGGDCTPATLSVCLDPGRYYLFVAPGAEEGFIRGAAPCPFDPKKNPDKDPPFAFWGFEYIAEATCGSCDPSDPADLNGDGVVNVLDLLILLGQWGDCPTGEACLPDLNGDETVNVLDMLVLIGAWG